MGAMDYNEHMFQHVNSLIFQWVLCSCSSHRVGLPSFQTFFFRNLDEVPGKTLRFPSSESPVLSDILDLVHGAVVTEVDEEVAKLEIAMFVLESVQE